MRNVVILGSTGSIGESAVWVAEHLRDEVRVVGLAAGRRWQRLAEQARAFDCRRVAIEDRGALDALRQALPAGVTATADADGLVEMVTAADVDTVLCGITGTAGFAPVLAAIEAGKDIALASKEILVMAGGLVMAAVRRRGVRLLPVDSEHSAIFQCLDGRPHDSVRRLILTASGGPFRALPAADLAAVTPAQALAHPTWRMGPKITIDSATLMNKALEMIEAQWLFDVRPEQVDVVIHPQSVIHSMVEFTDGSLLAQMGRPDMRLPIQYALTYPARRETPLPRFAFDQAATLTFEPPDPARFPALRLARQAMAAGGTLPAVLNAANEVAVAAFLDGRLSFPGIWGVVEAVMTAHRTQAASSIESVLAADAWARRAAAASSTGR